VDSQNLPPTDSKRRRYLVLLLLLIVGAISVIMFRLWQVKTAGNIPFIPQQSLFVLKPPSDALEGKLLLSNGNIKKKPRDKAEFNKINVGEEILQGERIAASEKSKAVIEFINLVKINLSSNTEIGFNNLIPANFLLSQSSGSVDYELLRSDVPISVRSLHTLVTINSGNCAITADQETITIKVLAGSATLALVDLENKTSVWEIKEGQEVLIDDVQRRVEVK
jgi:hypothetical protein